MRELELIANVPPEVIVLDEEEQCTYLPERVARQPLRLPIRMLSHEELDARLDAGDRRYGRFLYNQNCPACRACEAIRIDVPAFRPSKTQRRTKRRGDLLFSVELGAPRVDDERVELFSKHELLRNLRRRGEPITAEGYARFLVDSCADGLEICYRTGDRLAGVAVMDRAADSLSAVYTYYDPDLHRASPGVYSILTQIELCRRWGLRWLYLGLYVAGCKELAYKADYLPHERRIDGVWTRFEKG
jgi:arginine-tRNA-protein transferase